MSFPGTGKIWMNGELVDWADAKIHIASHVVHYGSAVFEGARCYDTPRGSRLLPARRAPQPAVRLRQDLPDGAEPAPTTSCTRPSSRRSRRTQFKACYIRPIVYRGYHTLGVNPLPCPVDTAVMLWDWGAYLGTGRADQRRRRPRQLVDARRAEHLPDAGQDLGELRELGADQDGGDRRGLQRGDRARHGRATSAKAAARTCSSSATTSSTRRRPPRRSSPASRATRSSRWRRTTASTVREEMLPRELLYIADEAFFVGTAVEVTPIRIGRQDPGRQRPPRPDHRGHPAGVLRRHQRRGRRQARLARVRLRRRAAPGRRRRDQGAAGPESTGPADNHAISTSCSRSRSPAARPTCTSRSAATR